jgi:hypothetical protein
MKYFFSFVAIIIGFAVNAQNVTESKISMSLGAQTGYYVDIAGADKKMVTRAFEDMAKSAGKIKENKKAKEFFITQTRLGAINGSSPVDIYIKFDEGKGQSTTTMFVDIGGAFVNSNDNPTQSSAVKQFMNEYYIEVRRRVITEELKVEEKKQADLEKDLRKLKDKKEDYHSDIDKYKLKIIEAEKNIEKNIADQGLKEKEIEAQKGTVIKVTEKLNNVGKKIQ